MDDKIEQVSSTWFRSAQFTIFAGNATGYAPFDRRVDIGFAYGEGIPDGVWVVALRLQAQAFHPFLFLLVEAYKLEQYDDTLAFHHPFRLLSS